MPTKHRELGNFAANACNRASDEILYSYRKLGMVLNPPRSMTKAEHDQLLLDAMKGISVALYHLGTVGVPPKEL